MTTLRRLYRRYSSEIIVAMVIVVLLAVVGIREARSGSPAELQIRKHVAFSELKAGMVLEVTAGDIAERPTTVKVLKVEREGVYLKMLSGLDDPSKKSDGITMDGMSVPISSAMWNRSTSHQLRTEPVSAADLEGYQDWKSSGGMFFEDE